MYIANGVVDARFEEASFLLLEGENQDCKTGSLRCYSGAAVRALQSNQILWFLLILLV